MGFALGTTHSQRAVGKHHGRLEVRPVWTVEDRVLIA